MPRQFASAPFVPSIDETSLNPEANELREQDDLMAAFRYEAPPKIAPEAIAQLRAERAPANRDQSLGTLHTTALPDTKSLPARLRPKTTKYKGITRIDHPAKRTFGYFVRLSWNKQRRSKFFSDSVHGDRLAALSAAIDWRNQAERELGKPRTERQVIGVSRTSTGIVGVRRTVKDGRDVYEATWREGSRIRRTSYSVAKHGEKRALSLARRARNKYERARQRSPAGD